MLNLHYTGIIMALGAAVLVAEAILLVAAKRRLARLGYAGLALILLGYVLYVYSFISQDYSLKPVYETSAPGLSLLIRIGSSWSGGGSSLVLFASITAAASLVLRLAIDRQSPSFIVMSNIIIASGVAIATLLGGFEKLDFQATTGMGINPLLKSLWLLPHPLTVFAGYSLIALSATLALGRHDHAALNTARLGWVLVTLGNITGGYWAYTTLGWGGYWVWDPVETSTLVPWLFLTAYFHAIPISKPLANAMLYASASSVFLSMAVTRTGLSPLHGFAEARTIAVAVLLLLLILFAALSINEVKDESTRFIEKTIESRSPFLIGMLLSFIALLSASIVTYIVLLIPVIAAASGRVSSDYIQNVLTLSGDRFVKATYPILFPALLVGLLSVPLCSLRDKLSLRTHIALALAALLAGGVLAIESYRGSLIWSPLSGKWTNVMISLSLPPLALALSSTIVAIILSIARFTHRSLGVSLLHFSLVLLVLGVVLSGPYAYNQRYYSDFATLRVGEELDLDGVRVKLVGYDYQIVWEPVDVYNAYRGVLPHYRLAGYWTLLLIATGWVESWSKAYAGMKTLESYGVLGALGASDLGFEKETSVDSIKVVVKRGDERQELEVNATRLKLEVRSVELNLDYGLERVNETDVRYVILTLILHGSIIVELKLDDKADFFSGAVVESFETRVSGVLLELPNGAVVELSGLTGNSPQVESGESGNLLLVLREASISASGLLKTGESTLPLPSLILDENIYYYARLSRERSELWNLLLRLGYLEVLADNTTVKTMTERASRLASRFGNLSELSVTDLARLAEAPPLPHMLPEGARLILYFEVIDNGRTSRQSVEIRFDINGELQGIRGTVPKPLIIRRGLTDIYVELYPPYHEKSVPVGGVFVFMPIAHGMMAQVPAWVSIPESQLFYFHEVFRSLDPVDKLGAAMLITLLNMQLGMPPELARAPPEIRVEASRWLDPMEQYRVWAPVLAGTAMEIDPFFLRIFTIRVSLSMLEAMTPSLFRVIEVIESFSIENSTIATEGLTVRVKTVHHVNLVWAGSIALVVSELYLVAVSLVGEARGRRSS